MGIDLESIAVGHAWLPPQEGVVATSEGVLEAQLPIATRSYERLRITRS